ncbi:unnamed protein product [Rotaria sp. Silwood1]|nr:unnamed protein product [Rotaria sp. Silwood1]CAF3689760.1 unnamed protein product [Rotaria sp. Silwood1]CAF3753369.1 unnamed protein product [Rotaria sp. Silwood1]CAF3828687.1 unnamed protein product [Rotaria sp. Silwood1]CAF3832260.1 unnamed protein product [Rotaria sp. Silwood1]
MQWARRNNTSGQTIISGVNCYGLTIDNNGYLYVSGYNKYEVRRWKVGDTHGTVIAGGNGQEGAKEVIVVVGGQCPGNSLTQLSTPIAVVVDHLGAVYVADYGNHQVMHWSIEATQISVVAGENGSGAGANQLYFPWSLSFDRQNNLYVVDYYNH